MNQYFQPLKNLYHLFQAMMANIIYGFPSRKLKVIGITGTDGKTTTTHLMAHILKSAGYKTSLVSSVYADIGGVIYDTGFHVTTPNPFLVQKLLKQSVDNHDQYFVLETTSHALDQNRVWGVRYEVGVLTNITHEHLDYHHDYNQYLTTKLKLLQRAKKAFVNTDDQSYQTIYQQLPLVIGYNSKFSLLNKLPKLTKFNQYNYSAGYRVARHLGLSDHQILTAMKSFVLPKGRVEVVYNHNFTIIIDFAHTPNALLKLLPEMKKLYGSKGRLIHVFGSAGLRDFTKRPLMGEISGQYADHIIVTEEDYRTEDPKIISQQIVSGIKKYSNDYEVIINRQQAINKAINMAKHNDVVVLTGKAHEKSLCRGKIEEPWSEHQAVIKAIANKKQKRNK